MNVIVVLFLHLLAATCGEKNLALRKPTVDSSNKPASAARAVDGNTDSNHFHGSCYHGGNQNNPWWQVDLEMVVLVTHVEITNRGDCCNDRIKDFSIDMYYESPLLNSRASSTRCLYYEGHIPTKGVPTRLYCAQNVFGRFLRLTSHTYYLINLCEMRVFGIQTPSCSNFVQQKGQRLTSPSILTSEPETASRSECASECHRRLDCLGFSIKYLPTVCCKLVNETTITEVDTGWDAFLLTRCYLNC